MSLMEMMREFSVFKQNKEIEEATQVAEEANRDYLRDELIKYVYKDEVVDQLIPAMELLQQYEKHDAIFDLLKFKEEEIQKLVQHKDHFEQQTSESDKELYAESAEEEQGEDLVMKFLNEKYSDE